jgi:sialate O-acetylesterase
MIGPGKLRLCAATLAAAAALMTSAATANVRLPRLVGDNMVLQRNAPVDLWGWADPGESIRIRFRGRTLSTRAGADGRWSARLAPLRAGGPDDLRIDGSNSVTLRNILVGDVWLASGQSNMQFPLAEEGGFGGANGADEEIHAADFPKIRLFMVERDLALDPKTDVDSAGWTAVTPATVRRFSAVAYFFGRELFRRQGVPVGLIESCWSGTPAETWMSKAALQHFPEFQVAGPALLPAAEIRTSYPQTPTLLWNAMIAPLTPYRVKGVIWYQGESNAFRAEQYRRLFPALINDWRGNWGYELPFLFVQLAGYGSDATEPAESAWAELREAQAAALALPHTGMAVAVDIGDAADIHPRNKLDVGHRLALAAARIAYGENVVASGPTWSSMHIDTGRIRLTFSNRGSGLRAKGVPPATSERAKLNGFTIAAADGRFVRAQAYIDGADVIVYSERIPQPAAVRYDWANTPDGNLYNAEGLPAVPFRTDRPF